MAPQKKDLINWKEVWSCTNYTRSRLIGDTDYEVDFLLDAVIQDYRKGRMHLFKQVFKSEDSVQRARDHLKAAKGFFSREHQDWNLSYYYVRRVDDI